MLSQPAFNSRISLISPRALQNDFPQPIIIVGFVLVRPEQVGVRLESASVRSAPGAVYVTVRARATRFDQFTLRDRFISQKPRVREHRRTAVLLYRCAGPVKTATHERTGPSGRAPPTARAGGAHLQA
ncbi:hypothetical protein EVAR_95695_1 [Eumeta japonica]|uniref:Uncharacterized protein n=1 Tax=Eumeta variegata TaxID=151549 RepID=A0A4C1VME1_EUMVA|nr:hypothetical protein EVAR_95695_1 [Eumeta japonica]